MSDDKKAPTPGEVARDVEAVRQAVTGALGPEATFEALSSVRRLGDWAARAQVLEAALAETMATASEVETTARVNHGKWRRAEAERDAAQLRVEVVEKHNAELMTAEAASTSEAMTLRSQVATLEAEARRSAKANELLNELWCAEKARAEAADVKAALLEAEVREAKQRVAELVAACERLEARHLAEAKDASEPLRTAYRYAAGAAKTVGAMARDAAPGSPATQPAPVGLLEAVGAVLKDAESSFRAGGQNGLVLVQWDKVLPLRAAYDAAKGGE